MARTMPSAPRLPQVARPSQPAALGSTSSFAKKKRETHIALSREKHVATCHELFSDLLQRPTSEGQEGVEEHGEVQPLTSSALEGVQEDTDLSFG